MTAIHLDEQSFNHEVLQSHLPVLVDYWAQWCGPCRAVAPVVESVAKAYDGKLKVGKLNVDDNPALARQYNIRSIPTLMLFKGGEIAATKVGSVSTSELKAFVDQYL